VAAGGNVSLRSQRTAGRHRTATGASCHRAIFGRVSASAGV